MGDSVNQEIDNDNILEIIKETGKQLQEFARAASPQEIRFFVSTYYTLQKQRIRLNNQLCSTKEEARALHWLHDIFEVLEKRTKGIMTTYAANHPVGQWAMSLYGIGPVITAGILATIDPEKATNPGKVWRLAGIDPTNRWIKSEKEAEALVDSVLGSGKKITEAHLSEIKKRLNRNWLRLETERPSREDLVKAVKVCPWNQSLKRLVYLASESFVKVGKGFYNEYYYQAKQDIQARNDTGAYDEYARGRKVGTSTVAYKSYSVGRLPDGHVHMRALRKVQKLFLSHCWQKIYENHYKTTPPMPWIIAKGGHSDFIPPPQPEK